MSRIRQFEATTKELLLSGELYGASTLDRPGGLDRRINHALRTDDYRSAPTARTAIPRQGAAWTACSLS